ncbi:hypothetical protein BDP81DRAFT_441306 [Colletotrichum phormii]|uniref:Uncharacterized protein n=1 Tax=Colletotrichum phormii TaxID=359342 RepID=A0AAJ0EAB1_9PEZI|nr:uncharacterized protein BDP81DRAFT_441306 [Colletotrichum phormii]KAK1622502.1 hypothetical protein BDP81DRAFT_441306 [Colletotrichum phormii]
MLMLHIKNAIDPNKSFRRLCVDAVKGGQAIVSALIRRRLPGLAVAAHAVDRNSTQRGAAVAVGAAPVRGRQAAVRAGDAGRDGRAILDGVGVLVKLGRALAVLRGGAVAASDQLNVLSGRRTGSSVGSGEEGNGHGDEQELHVGGNIVLKD